MRRQYRRIAEGLVEPARDLRQQLKHRVDRERLLVMIGPEVTSDRAGIAAFVEARVFESDRERVHIAGRLDFAERRGDAR